MAYIVSGQAGQSAVAYLRATPVQALDKAIEMIGAGCADVTIEDQASPAFSHAEFDKVYLSKQSHLTTLWCVNQSALQARAKSIGLAHDCQGIGY